MKKEREDIKTEKENIRQREEKMLEKEMKLNEEKADWEEETAMNSLADEVLKQKKKPNPKRKIPASDRIMRK